MQILRQSTQIIVRIGPAVAVGDGFTPVASLSLGSADEAELLKANTTTTTDISGATFAAITGCDGWYGLTLTTSHTDTVGCLDVMINDDSLILPIYARFQVIEEAAYDAMYASSADPKADINVASIDANAITATAIASDAITSAKIADSAITANKIASDAITAAKIADGAIDANTFAAGAITASAIAADAIGASELAADAIAEIADAVWDEDATGHQTGGTFGQAIGDPGADTNTIYKAVVTDATGATVGVDVAAVLADTGTDGVIVASIANNAITAAAIANAAIDAATFAADVDAEILSYLVDDATRIDASSLNTATVTTIPAILVDTGTTLDGKIDTIDSNVDAILVDTSTTLQGELDGIQADTEDLQSKIGSPAGASLAADVAAVKSDTAAILTDTGTTLDGKIDTIDTVVDAIKAKTDSLNFGVTGKVDANITHVNEVEITGDGDGTPWGPV